MKAEFQFRHDQRALISEICIPFTLSRLRLDNSAAGVRHSSYFEIHRLVIGMMGAGSATIVSRRGGEGAGREVTHYKRTAFRYMLNIPYSESRQHRWLIYGRVEHSWKHRIYRGLHSPPPLPTAPYIFDPAVKYLWKGQSNHRIVRSN